MVELVNMGHEKRQDYIYIERERREGDQIENWSMLVPMPWEHLQ